MPPWPGAFWLSSEPSCPLLRAASSVLPPSHSCVSLFQGKGSKKCVRAPQKRRGETAGKQHINGCESHGGRGPPARSLCLTPGRCADLGALAKQSIFKVSKPRLGHGISLSAHVQPGLGMTLLCKRRCVLYLGEGEGAIKRISATVTARFFRSRKASITAEPLCSGMQDGMQGHLRSFRPKAPSEMILKDRKVEVQTQANSGTTSRNWLKAVTSPATHTG